MSDYAGKHKPYKGRAYGGSAAARKRWKARRAASEFNALRANTLANLMA